MGGASKRKEELKENKENEFIFQRKNYVFMLIGLAVIVIGFILMSGGGSDNPEVFNPDIFSPRRIRLAPAIVVIGFAIEVYAILLNPEKSKS